MTRKIKMKSPSSTYSSNLFSTSNLEAILDSNDISHEVQSHLKLVYLGLSFMFGASIIGTYLGIIFHVTAFLGVIGCLGTACWIHSDQDKENYHKRISLLALFGFFEGISIGPLINLAIMIDPFIILVALACTMIIFISFSLAALTSQRRSYLYLGGFLSSALMILCFTSFIGFFVPSLRMVQLQLYGGLAVFSGFVIYDTQLIIEKASNGCKDFAGHALSLFMDLIQIFVRILMILMKNRKNNSSNSSVSSILPTHRGEL